MVGRAAVAADRARAAARRAGRRSPSDIKPALGDEGDAGRPRDQGDRRPERRRSTPPTSSTTRACSRSSKAALHDAGRRRQTIPPSQFMNEISWVSPPYVAAKLGTAALHRRRRRRRHHARKKQPTGPGLHGTGLNATVLRQRHPAPGRVEPARPTSRARRSRSSFTNQGDNDEFNVKVTLKIARASGGSPITLNKTVPQIAKGEKATGRRCRSTASRRWTRR